MLPDGNHWQRRHGLNSLLLLAWPVLFNLFGDASAHANLVIKATFDSTITSDPNAAVIESTINSVIALYEASFSDPITVTITFHETTDALICSLLCASSQSHPLSGKRVLNWSRCRSL